MNNRLQIIIDNKYRELEDKKQSLCHTSFKNQLQKNGLSVIAEVKRASPSKGDFSEIENPVELATQYVTAGAAAVSVLTDEKFFKGSLDDLHAVSRALNQHDVAILRKDFIVDARQVAEAVVVGASAVLLIVAVLGERLKKFVELCKLHGIDALVEVHDETECAMAIAAGAEIIGINNRNLKTFDVDIETAFLLKSKIPENIITIAESGILNPELAQRYYQAGFDAVLVGEMLVKADDPKILIREMRGEDA